jgi:hypothetical protein
LPVKEGLTERRLCRATFPQALLLKPAPGRADLHGMSDGPPEGLHDAIESSQDGNERLEQSVLVGWVVVAEWAGVDGTRTLTRMSGTPGGAVPPEWQTRGYLHEALFGKWNSDS